MDEKPDLKLIAQKRRSSEVRDIVYLSGDI